MNENEIITEINKIVMWYNKLHKDYTGINELMYQRIQLVTLLCYFSSTIGEYRVQWKEAEAQTEIVKREKTKEFTDAGYPLSKAQELGKFYSTDQYLLEKRYDGAYNSLKFVYETTNAVIDCMNQHISNLKREEENNKKLV